MRNVTQETLIPAFLDYMDDNTDPRIREVLESLVRHLHGFATEVNLTHAEWRAGLELLMRAGEISSPDRNEFVLFSDVLGLSSRIDMLHSKPGATPSSVLGPFHMRGAPTLPVGANLKKDNTGQTVIFSGVIKNKAGQPINGAEMEMWQTAENGLYSNIDPEQSEYNLRAHMKVGSDGRYAFTTVRPAPYVVPDDGPVGDLLRATGRHPWRPSHLHFIVDAPGYRNLVSEVFPVDDPYIDEDAVLAVREQLIMEYVEQTDLSLIPDDIEDREQITAPYYTVDFDFILGEDD